MAEYKETVETPETQEKTFTPVYSYTQKINNLIAEGKITKPKYRTLSQEQMTTYYTAKDLPDYDRQKIKAGILKANEQSFEENWDAATTIAAMDLITGEKERLQMAIGNVLATEDYSKLIEPAATVGGFSVGAKAGAKAAAKFGARKLGTAVAGMAAGAVVGGVVGAAAGGIVGLAVGTEPAGDDLDTIVDENERKRREAIKTLQDKGYSQEQIDEIIEFKQDVQNVGLQMLRAAQDSARQRAETMPYIDPDSAALKIVGGLKSAGELAIVGWAAGAARAGITKKILEKQDRWGRRTPAVERLSRIKGVETGTTASLGLMDIDIMGEGAIASVQKYIEDTGDTELVNYKGDIKNVAIDGLNARIQNIIEKKYGIPGLFTKAVGKRITSAYGEWLNGFAQEFSQGVTNDFFEWTKGNQTAQDIVKNIPSNLVDGLIGAVIQGGIGTGIYTYYHNESVNQLHDVIMAQSTKENPIDEQKARAFAEAKINELENEITNDITNEVVGFIDAKDYKGKIYETVRDNLKKTVDYQRKQMKDTLEGSKYDDMTEDELAQHIESVAQDMTDRVVINALDEKIPLSEVPQLKGETIDGTYYIEGSDYAQMTDRQAEAERQSIRDAVYAERQAIREEKEAQKKIAQAEKQAKKDSQLAEKMAEGAEKARAKRELSETAQQTREAEERERMAEKSAKAMEKSIKTTIKATKENKEQEQFPNAEIEIAVFEPNQIKSVDNRGTYSSDTGNIYLQTQQRGKGGAYDARTRAITLGSGANITTLPHELAHYWIDKNFRWARSGHASEAWLKQWMAVEKWLGIDPEDKRLNKYASEKFARAYERFLAEEQLPLVLQKSMADFRDFVLDHYDYELDDAKGLQDRFGRPIKLNEDAKQWFRKSIYESYMSPMEEAIVNERLAVADEEYKEIEPELKKQQEIENIAKNSTEIKNVAPTGTEIQTSAGVSNADILGKRTIGGGEIKESQGKIGAELGKTYESTNWDAQEEMVANYLQTVSTDEALDALDNGTYPDKIDANFLRQALVDKLLSEGRELEAAALIEETADDFTESAQKLQAARRINTPFTNAIRMLTVGKAIKLAEAKYGKTKDAVAELDKAINALVAKYEQQYANATTDEERELVFATMQDEAVRTIGTLDKSVSDRIDFQDIEDKEERKQAKELRKRQIRRASIKAYRSRAKRALKQALGLEPTREQVREIKKLSTDVARTIKDYRQKVRENKLSALDPTSILEAQNKLNEYMNKQLPPRVLTNVADAINSYMMANMLWNPATNVFNIESTWVQMIPHMMATYINYGKGTIAWSEKLKLIKQALALQAKTGYNIFSLRDFFDKKTLWAEKYYEPKTIAGKIQAFPLTMLGLADTMNKGVVFLQRADSMATKQATEEGKKNGWTKEQITKRAKELFYQALNTDPRTITKDGLKIRESAVKEGEEATFTQMTKTAEMVNKFRKFLNFGKGTGLGNLIMPFTTTIANIAEDTVLNYGIGSVRGLVNAPKALITQFDKTATAEMKKEAWKAIAPETKNVIKNIIGILMLLGIALDSDDEDYVLGYDRQTEMDKDIRQNRNAPSGYAIRIGNKWIDLDLFGIGSPWAKTYLIAKRNGFAPDGWVKGFASMIDLVPGVGEIQSIYDRYSTTQQWSGEWEALSELGSDKIADITERLIPAQAFLNQIGNITDESKRVTWEKWYHRAMGKIPGLRKMLPERTSKQTGKVIPQTDDWFNLATGQRVKDYIAPTSADKARYEFALSGKALSYREANSKLKELGKDTKEYNEAVSKVRKLFTEKLAQESKKPSYKAADIDTKRKIANNLHKDAMEEIKKQYGLVDKKPKRKKQLKKK